MRRLTLEMEMRYGLPVFKEEYRCRWSDDEKTKEILRDERTHILATCMAAYPFTPTKVLAKEFGIKASTINTVARMYGIEKSKEIRSAINRENGSKATSRAIEILGKTVEKVAKNGRVVAVFKSAGEAARAIGVGKHNIVSRCNGRIKSLLNGYRYRYKSE